jgi:hypothetical protein
VPVAASNGGDDDAGEEGGGVSALKMYSDAFAVFLDTELAEDDSEFGMNDAILDVPWPFPIGRLRTDDDAIYGYE